MVKQRRNHPELTDDEYRLLPDVINTGAVIQQGEQRIVFFNDDDRIYRAAVKTTTPDGENHIVSFYRIDADEYERELTNGQLIREAIKKPVRF